MKTSKLVFYISTGLLTLLMLFSVSMYLFNHIEIQTAFLTLGYPTYIIYPLAFVKILGLIAIWFIANKSLKEWAYAGFFFNFVLAFFAHYMISDGEHMGALAAIIVLVVSYIFNKKVNNGR
ncbi:DoxX family protein [Polaribacter cellanae]|uniref:DoxX family protein n=1 Tax=Polaribacter cellanae TaxID=2818493 RepID=A0A975CNV9_9FLAO|nr:DoxX family protein [Polaribacter cellanae]QTE22660.1 DoxX family protein [Polaribacter cellanae]